MGKGSKFNWQIVGHVGPRKFLERNIENRTLAHAYVFSGPHQIGKLSVAKRFGNFLICEKSRLITDFVSNEEVVYGCGECNTCRMLARGLYPDLYIVERVVNENTDKMRTEIIVSQIRELVGKLSRHAFHDSYKIVIIPEAEAMNAEASNCLLKFLEEPTDKTILILLTTREDMLLPTILSRCQRLSFSLVPREDIYQHLLTCGASPVVAREIAALSQGRATMAQKFFEDPTFYAEYRSRIVNWWNFFGWRSTARFQYLEKYFKSADVLREQIEADLDIISSLIRDAIFLQTGLRSYVVNNFMVDSLMAWPTGLCHAHIFLEKIEKSRRYLSQNVSPKFIFENLLT
jgi:DNA polymerase-3 subunit delta'